MENAFKKQKESKGEAKETEDTETDKVEEKSDVPKNFFLNLVDLPFLKSLTFNLNFNQSIFDSFLLLFSRNSTFENIIITDRENN